MSENDDVTVEIENHEDPKVDLDPKTFDLAAALAGQTYPKERVLVPLNREMAREYVEQQARERHARFAYLDEEVIQREKERLTEIENAVAESSLIIELTGLTREAASALAKDMQATIDKMKEGLDGDEDVVFELGEKLNREAQFKSWSASITKVTNYDGDETPLTDEAIYLLIDKLPPGANDAVNKAIENVDKEARNGYEVIVKNSDFLSAL